MKTRLISVILILPLLFASCSLSKKVFKDKQSHKSEEVTESQTMTNTQTVTNTHIIEEFDTSVTSKPQNIVGQKPVNEVLSGLPVVIENEEMNVTLQYDSATQALNVKAEAKPQKIPVKGKRTIDQSKIENQQKQEEKKQSKKEEDKAQTTNKEVKNPNIALYLICAGSVLVILLFVFLWKKIKNIPIIRSIFGK